MSRSYLSVLLGEIVGGLVKSSLATLSLKLAFSGLSFAASVLLTRSLNPKGFGAYSYVLASLGVLSVGGIFGMDQLLIRNVAACREREEWTLLRGLVQGALCAGIAIALLLAVITALGLLGPYADLGADTRGPMLFGLLLLPVMVFNRLRQAALQGLGRIVAAQTPDLLIQPLVFFALTGAGVYLLGGTLSTLAAIGLTLAATAVAALVGLRSLLQAFPLEARRVLPRYDTRRWLRQTLPLLLLSVCAVITARVDVLLLGALRGAESVGVYSAASRGADLITFVLAAFNMALAPTIARLFAAGELGALQQTITRSSRLVLLLSLPIALTLIIFGHWLLLVFGPQFTVGHTALVILGIGQIVNVASGPVTLLLTMSGHEADAAKIIAATAVWNVVANALCIARWGIEGAAIATTTGLIFWNVLMALQVRRRIGIHPTAFGALTVRAHHS